MFSAFCFLYIFAWQKCIKSRKQKTYKAKNRQRHVGSGEAALSEVEGGGL